MSKTNFIILYIELNLNKIYNYIIINNYII